MLNTDELFENLKTHIMSLRSASFLCTEHAAFESWFRVELAPVLWDLRYPSSSIHTKYTYPNSRNTADLRVIDQQGDIIFELKSFVSGADSKKRATYPQQIKRLEGLLNYPNVLQVVAFTTFIGYSESKMKNYMEDFFKNDDWSILGPKKIIPEYPLHIAIASMTK